jgi:LysM repeat protein
MKTPSTYVVKFPKGATAGKGKDYQMWMVASNMVESVFSGNFTPVNSRWNAYYNPDKTHPSWAGKLRNSQMVGHHLVGTLQDQIQHAKNLKKKDQKMAASQQNMVAQNVKTKDYTVKPGDSLFSIAGKSMAKVEQIKRLNGLKSNTIHPGQVLKII